MPHRSGLDRKSRARGAGASRALLVLGMHRSGTSALAGALGLLGVHLGNRLLPGTAANAGGYFEDEDVLAIHERLLYELDRTWDDIRPLPDRWWQQEAARHARGRLRQVLSGLSRAPIWAVKDPRLCRLLPAWTAVRPALRVEPTFIIIIRDPREAARSLAARDGMPAWKSHLLYLRSMVSAETATRRSRRLAATYHQPL